MLNGSLREGDHVVTVTTSASQAATEDVELLLAYVPSGGTAETLASASLPITIIAPGAQPALRTTLHARAIASACGDLLVLRARHRAGSQTLFPFALALDLP